MELIVDDNDGAEAKFQGFVKYVWRMRRWREEAWLNLLRNIGFKDIL